VAALAPLPFVESLGGSFVYDDHLLIEEPASVHSLGRVAELWQSEFWHGLGAIHFRYLRPLVSTSYAIDWSVWQGHPFGFHLTNLCVHALVALLLYASLCRWSDAPLGALLATLAWAWHPSKVEAVAWISGRTDLLCALGVLVACAGVHRRLQGARAEGWALEAAGLFVALASKEHGVVAPAFIAMEAWAHGERRPLDLGPMTSFVDALRPSGGFGHLRSGHRPNQGGAAARAGARARAGSCTAARNRS